MALHPPEWLKGRVVWFHRNVERKVNRGGSGLRSGKVCRVNLKRGKLDSLTVNLVGLYGQKRWGGGKVRIPLADLMYGGVQWRGNLVPLDCLIEGDSL